MLFSIQPSKGVAMTDRYDNNSRIKYKQKYSWVQARSAFTSSGLVMNHHALLSFLHFFFLSLIFTLKCWCLGFNLKIIVFLFYMAIILHHRISPCGHSKSKIVTVGNKASLCSRSTHKHVKINDFRKQREPGHSVAVLHVFSDAK